MFIPESEPKQTNEFSISLRIISWTQSCRPECWVKDLTIHI